MNVDLNLIKTEDAQRCLEHLKGTPTENRVVVIYNSGDKKTESGILLPGTVKEDLPRKGVVIAIGPVTEEYETYRDMLKIGSIITYGLYAGKELEPSWKGNYKPLTDWKFSVLSLNEIIFVEPNE